MDTSNENIDSAPAPVRIRPIRISAAGIPERFRSMKFSFDKDEVKMVESRYPNGSLRIDFITVPDANGFSKPFATLTTNCTKNRHLGDGEFFVKTWSENEPMINILLASGIFVEVSYYYPAIWKFAV